VPEFETEPFAIFAQLGQWPLVAMFSGVLMAALAAIIVLVRAPADR